MTAEHFKHKVGVLTKHCEDWGRDPSEIKNGTDANASER